MTVPFQPRRRCMGVERAAESRAISAAWAAIMACIWASCWERSGRIVGVRVSVMGSGSVGMRLIGADHVSSVLAIEALDCYPSRAHRIGLEAVDSPCVE